MPNAMGESDQENRSMADQIDYAARFGLTLAEAYQVALDVYRREKDGARFSYPHKIQLSAFWRQSTHGPFTPEKFGDVGFFDFVGNDRRKAWQALGDLDQDSAKLSFIKLLSEIHQDQMDEIGGKMQEAKRQAEEEAARKAQQEAERRAREEAERKEQERRLKEEQERRLRQEQEERQRQSAQNAALLAQHHQNQSLLERERQQRALQEAQRHQAQSGEQRQLQSDQQQQSQDTRHGTDQVDGGAPRIATPEVWTRPERTEFIGQMKQDPESVIVLGHGETVTVKAVTNPAGSRMFWEFATENYDLAFGVSFQWPAVDGVEGKIVEVLPSERKQSHQVVIGGSHAYPGPGTYLIQFDNTYSVLRAKTVFYRVYYAA